MGWLVVEEWLSKPLGRGLIGLLGLILGLSAWCAQAQLNDTGQDKCYDGSALVPCTTANTGDMATYPRQDGRFGRDAAATAGVLSKTGGGSAGFDFTKVCMSGQLAGQGSCPADPPVGTGTNEWACTKDNHTNLIWSLDSPVIHWTATSTYTAAMNASNRCGYNSGWRSPTRRELLSIVHNGTGNPAIDTGYFPNTTVVGYYWTGQTAAPWAAVDVYWYVGFSSGNTVPMFYKRYDSSPRRLVRSGDAGPPGGNFTIHPDGTVTDTVTGLVWDRCTWGKTGQDCSSDSASTHTWQAALGVAVTANAINSGAGYKGYNDWRLPSKDELESLVDMLSSTPPAINTTAFPNTPGARHWTSTTYAPDPAVAWGVNFGPGDGAAGAEAFNKGLDSYIRLVRSGQSFGDFDLLESLSGPPARTPAISPWGLGLLASLLAGLGGFQLRRGRRGRKL